jgi:hypothetical protein
MADAINVIEKSENGKVSVTPKNKIINTAYIEHFESSGINNTKIYLKGRGGEDSRILNENITSVLSKCNEHFNSLEPAISLTVLKKEGQIESSITPYIKGFMKSEVVEFFADPKDEDDRTILITAKGDNDMERSVWYIDGELFDIFELFIEM